MIPTFAVIAVVALWAALVWLFSREDHVATAMIEEGCLVVVARGLNAVWTFRRKVRIPVADITAVSCEVPRRQAPSGWRLPGLQVPGVAMMGTYRRAGQRFLWIVGRTRRVCVIQTTGASYDAIVVELDAAGRGAVRGLSGNAGSATERLAEQPSIRQ